MVLCAENRRQNADDDLEMAIRLNPDCQQAYRLRALIHATGRHSARDLKQALTFADQACELSLNTDWSAFGPAR